MLEEKIPLWEHQKTAIQRARNRDHFALFFEMGTGKTATTINILREKYSQNKRLLRTLILCPLIVTENWKREFVMHSKINPDDILILQGSQVKRIEKLRKKVVSEEGLTKFYKPAIIVTNYEAMAVMNGLHTELIQWAPEVLVCDESHKLKAHNSKRTKAVQAIADRARYKYILSGTPILNSPLDIFSQFRIMDGGRAFAPNGTNFFGFRARFFHDFNAHMPKDRYFPDFRVRPGAVQEMNKIIQTTAMRVTKEECLDLPPLVKEMVFVDMTPAQQRAYDEMKRDFVTYVQDDACVATLAITKALRLQQIVSGYIQLETGKQTKIKNSPRQEALSEILEAVSGEHKVLIWAVFRENYDQIRDVCNELKLPFVEVHGDIPNAQKFINVERFNTDPSCRVFLGHPGSGGIGINLVSASYSIFYSRNFSLEQDVQAESRNHRGGQTKKVTRIDIVTPNTIDELILKKLATKSELGDKMLQTLREFAKEL